MNIYKVVLDKYDYDEYDSFVVYADNSAVAEHIVMTKVNPDYLENGQFVESVELLGTTKGLDLYPFYPVSGVILGSFNAG